MQREATRTANSGLYRLHYCFDFRHLKLTGCFDGNVCRDAIFDNQGKSLAAHAHSETRAIKYEVERLCVVAIAVGKHEDRVADVAIFTPGMHNKYIINGHAGHRIDALRLQRLSLLYESR